MIPAIDLTFRFIHKLLHLEDRALKLYMFYMKLAMSQETTAVHATNRHCRNELGWSKGKFQKAKHELTKNELIKYNKQQNLVYLKLRLNHKNDTTVAKSNTVGSKVDPMGGQKSTLGSKVDPVKNRPYVGSKVDPVKRRSFGGSKIDPPYNMSNNVYLNTSSKEVSSNGKLVSNKTTHSDQDSPEIIDDDPQVIMNHWNKYKTKTVNVNDPPELLVEWIVRAMDWASSDELKMCIDNYYKILNDDKYFYTHPYRLDNFIYHGITPSGRALKRGFWIFHDDNKPFDRFDKSKPKTSFEKIRNDVELATFKYDKSKILDTEAQTYMGLDLNVCKTMDIERQLEGIKNYTDNKIPSYGTLVWIEECLITLLYRKSDVELLKRLVRMQNKYRYLANEDVPY